MGKSTSVSAGTLLSPTANGLGTADVIVTGTGEVVLAGGTVANNFSIIGNGPTTSPGGVGRTPGALVLNNNAILTGTVTLTGDARVSSTGILGGSTLAGTISGKITGAYQLEVSSGGAQNGGVLTLSNSANDYTGGTRVSSGGTSSTSDVNLVLGASNVIPNGVGKGNVTINGLNYSGDPVLTLSGNSDTINGLNSSGWSHNIVVENASNATDATLTVGDADANGYFIGTIRNGTGSKLLNLTKIGTGTQTLGRANTYTGVTRVEAGVLEIDFGGYAASTSSSITNYLAPNSSLELAGGTLKLQGRADGADVTQNLTTGANPRAITFSDVTGLSAGQEISIADATAKSPQRIAWISGNTAYLSDTFILAAGAHDVSVAAKSFTHTQTLASVDLSANSTLDFGSDTSMILTFNAITQSVDNTILTIASWTGDVDAGGGLNQLRFTGTYDALSFPLSQAEVLFTGFDPGYAVHQEAGYFEITPIPIPEPTVLDLLTLVGLGTVRRRRT